MGLIMDIFEEYRLKGLQEGLKQGLKQGIEKGLKQGLEKGLRQGIEKGLKQAAVNMYKEGLELEFISKVLKVDIDTIKTWLKEENLF